jgi:O-antigen/teichoic acid export membrane protein
MQGSMSAIHGVRATAVWAAAGTAAQLGCQVIALVVLARLLSPYEFGVVSAAALLTQLALIFCEFGVGPYVVQRAHLGAETLGTCYAASCALGLLIAALLWLGAPLLARLLHVAELRLVLRAYSVVFIIMGASAVHDALLQRELNFRFLAHADAISFVLGYAGVSIACALGGLSYWSIVIGHLSQAGIRAVMVIARHPQVARARMSLEELRPLLRFGGGQTLSRLAAFIASQADGFVVTARLGVASIGYYGRANQLVTMPTAQLGQLFDKVIFPTVARIQHDRSRAAAAYRMSVSVICLLSLPLCVLIWMLGPHIVHVALGSQWDAVVDPVRVLALAIPLRLLHKVSDPTARALGATYSRAWRQGLFALAVIALSLLLSRYGLTAVAWGVVAAAALDAALMVWLCASLTGLSAPQLLRATFPGAAAAALGALLAGLAVLAMQPWRNNDAFVLLVAGSASLGALAVVVHRYREYVR